MPDIEADLRIRVASLEARLAALERMGDAAPERQAVAGYRLPWFWVRLTQDLWPWGMTKGNFVYQQQDGSWVETDAEIAGIWAPYRFSGAIAAGRAIRVSRQPPFGKRPSGRLYAIGADCG